MGVGVVILIRLSRTREDIYTTKIGLIRVWRSGGGGYRGGGGWGWGLKRGFMGGEVRYTNKA